MLPTTFAFCLLLSSYAAAAQSNVTGPPTDESLQCSGTGVLMFEGDGRFSIVRDNGNAGGLMCQGDISFMADSELYTRIISDGRFVCNASSSVRLCGYGDAELITSDRYSSMLQCNGMPLFPRVINPTTTFCVGNGSFSVQGFGNYSITAATLVCTGNVITISSTAYNTAGDFSCIGNGAYNISGNGELFSVSADSGNCTVFNDYCTVSGEYSLGAEGTYNISTQSGNISCFGDVTPFGSYVVTFGAFFCQGQDILILNGSGLIYSVMADNFNNCTGLIDDTLPVSANFSIRTSCVGDGANAFIGNGQFNITINSSTPNSGLMCDGSVNEVMVLEDIIFTQSFGPFRCISSGLLSLTGTGVIADEDLVCNVILLTNSTIMPTNTFSATPTIIPTESPTTNTILPTETPTPSLNKYCTGSGNFSLSGEGLYDVNILNKNISCFGAIFAINNSQVITFGPFFCEGQGTFVLNGTGLLYSVRAIEFNSCTDLIDNISDIRGNTSVRTSCMGNGVIAFLGNGQFNVIVNTSFLNSGLTCLGNVNENLVSTDTVSIESFGPFRCIASGYLSINGVGVIEDDHLLCSVSPINNGESLECSGTGRFEIIGSGFFDIVAIPEITCTGNGEFSTLDMGERFMSRGSFVCNGSEVFFLNGTGEIESVITDLGSNNCTDVIPIGSGSGVTNAVTCSGEGEYVFVGDGNFFVNRTGPGMLQCNGEVTAGANRSQRAEYFTNGEFNCIVNGIVYFTGTGRAEVINASASYECNGVFFPGPTVEPPFSGFGGDEIACFAYGEYVVVGNGRIQLSAQLPATPLNCQGAVSTDLDQNITTSSGDFICTGNGFVHIVGRGEVFVNSTGFNNCTRSNAMIINSPLLCSGSGEYEIFGSANATIFASDALLCNGEVYPLTSSGPGSFYYAGGYYRCTSNGLFNISGVGNVIIVNTTNTSDTDGYSCFEFQSLLTCATFSFGGGDGYENVTVTGNGEFTIIGDEALYCTGNAVLCPGEINYYFTDGYFYCFSDSFVYINGTGTIENVTGVNNCSGVGFGIPPIISGTPLSPQPSCIGFGNQYQINGNGTFNTSRLLGRINCSVPLQEPNSDIYTFSSNQESFNCSGSGIFMFDGIGDSIIILDNGYFNCMNVTPSTSVVITTPTVTTSMSASLSTMITTTPTLVPSVSTPMTSVSTSLPSVSTPTASVPTSVPSVSTPTTTVSTSIPSVSTPTTGVSTPTTTVSTSIPSVSTPTTTVSTSASSVSTLTTNVSTPTTSISSSVPSVSSPITGVSTPTTTVSTSVPSESTPTTSVSTPTTSVSNSILSVSISTTSALATITTSVTPTITPVVIPRIKLVDLTDNEKDNTITLEFKEFNTVEEFNLEAFIDILLQLLEDEDERPRRQTAEDTVVIIDPTPRLINGLLEVAFFVQDEQGMIVEGSIIAQAIMQNEDELLATINATSLTRINGLSESLNELAEQNNNDGGGGDDDDDDGLSGGIIALIVILVLLAVSVPAVIVIVYLVYKNRRKGQFDIFKGSVSHRTDYVADNTAANSSYMAVQQLESSHAQEMVSSETEPPTEKLVKEDSDTDEPDRNQNTDVDIDKDTRL